jgi:hypothetical protein|nr:MAG TPA: hypothetical protein [Caudoviricetes sp.]
MVENSLKGVKLPEFDDPLLPGLARAFNTAGLIQVATSVTDARGHVDDLAKHGIAPTVANPAYLDILGQLYKCDGTKSGSGSWLLKALNEVEMDTQTYNASGAWYSVSSGQYYKYYSANLPVRPYRRLVLSFVTGWANVTGDVDLYLWVKSAGNVRSAFNAGGNDQQSNALFNFGIVEANETPQVEWGIYGRGASGGSARFTTDGTYNRFMTVAFPISM